MAMLIHQMVYDNIKWHIMNNNHINNRHSILQFLLPDMGEMPSQPIDTTWALGSSCRTKRSWDRCLMWKSSGNHVDMDVSHSESYLLYLDYKQRVFHIHADIFAWGCVERVDLNNKKCMIWNDFAGNWILRPLKTVSLVRKAGHRTRIHSVMI